MSDLIQRAFAALPPEAWSTSGRGVLPEPAPAPSPVAEVRARLQRGLCPACGGAVTLPGWKALLCPACRPVVGYCPRCECVKPVSGFSPPRPAKRWNGTVRHSYCKACEVELSHARRALPPCAHCGTKRDGKRLLCAACREHYGRCSTCKEVKPLACFGPPGKNGQHCASRCRHCDALRVAARRKGAGDGAQ